MVREYTDILQMGRRSVIVGGSALLHGEERQLGIMVPGQSVKKHRDTSSDGRLSGC